MRAVLRSAPARCGVSIALCLTLAASVWVIFAGRVRADGGAPNLAYVVRGGKDSGDLVVLDMSKQCVVGHIRIGGDPRAVILSPDASTAYVTEAAADRLAMVDTSTQQVEATLPAGAGPGAMAWSGTTFDLYIADARADMVTVVDLIRQRGVGTIKVEEHPSSLAVAEPITDYSTGTTDADIFVTSPDSGTVSVISAKRGR